MKYLYYSFFGFLLFLAGVVVQPGIIQAAEICTFTKDFDIGVINEEVRCLQEYLNDNGYTIASSGVGSPGRETNMYQSLTKAAVVRWQKANGITPASGYFGPLSRAKYLQLMSGNILSDVVTTPVVTTSAKSATQKNADDYLIDAISILDDARDEVFDLDSDDKEYDDAVEFLQDAEDAFGEAVLEYISRDYDQAIQYADDAIEYAQDAIDEVDGGNDNDDASKSDAEDAIDDAEEWIDDAWDEVDDFDGDTDETDLGEGVDPFFAGSIFVGFGVETSGLGLGKAEAPPFGG